MKASTSELSDFVHINLRISEELPVTSHNHAYFTSSFHDLPEKYLNNKLSIISYHIIAWFTSELLKIYHRISWLTSVLPDLSQN